MDAAQLREAMRKLTEQVAKDEHELMTLSQKINGLKRTIPENKRKLEKLQRDTLATEALSRRRKVATDAYNAEKNLK
jgi:predicted RNase H-like nuclease (RuvC/YqgF family)